MRTLNWTTVEREYPRINPMPDSDGEDECPECHGRSTLRRRNLATMSPSDDFDVKCHVCDGEGRIFIEDDR